MNNSTEQRIDRLEAMMEQIASLLLQQKSQSPTSMKDEQDTPGQGKTWLNSLEAAQLLQLPITKSKTYIRILKWYRDKGFICKFQGTKPVWYLRKELEKLSERIQKGEVAIPPIV